MTQNSKLGRFYYFISLSKSKLGRFYYYIRFQRADRRADFIYQVQKKKELLFWEFLDFFFIGISRFFLLLDFFIIGFFYILYIFFIFITAITYLYIHTYIHTYIHYTGTRQLHTCIDNAVQRCIIFAAQNSSYKCTSFYIIMYEVLVWHWQ